MTLKPFYELRMALKLFFLELAVELHVDGIWTESIVSMRDRLQTGKPAIMCLIEFLQNKYALIG